MCIIILMANRKGSSQNDFQGTRMEERLDDAINVLRNHCEPQMLGLGGGGPGGIDPSLLSGGSLQAMANSASNPAGTVKQERDRPGPGSEWKSVKNTEL